MEELKKCPFCGRSAPEVHFTKEHVLRAHLEQFVVGLLPGFTVQQWYQPKEGAPFSRAYESPGSTFDVTVNKICGCCNNGWMNRDVELPAERALIAMIQGRTLQIDPQVARAVSTWAAKTACVRALMDRPPYAIPEPHYRHIRERLEPPPGTLVWVGHTEAFHTAVTRHSRWGLQHHDRPLAHLTTFQIGRMVLFVLGNARPEQPDLVLPVVLRMATSPVLRLWSFQGATQWPPRAEMPLVESSSLSSFKGGFW